MKIFGLAVLLLSLTVVLACFLLWHVNRLQGEFQVIAQREVPLAAVLSNLDEDGLQRGLAFERWFGELNASQPDAEFIKAARADYRLFTGRLYQEFINAEKLLVFPVHEERHREKLSQIRAMLAKIKSADSEISAGLRQALELQMAGEHKRAIDLMKPLFGLLRLVRSLRDQIQDTSIALVQDAAETATAHQRQAFWLTVVVTSSAVLLGLMLSAVIAHRLAEPLRSLIGGLKSVEQGDLSVELPVVSQDEVGDLTQSFNYFVSELRAKEEIKRTFRQYIDPRVLEQVILQPGAEADGRRVMTVSFADLEGFTSIGEQLTASGLVNLLNRHFTLQAEAVQQQRGIIDKFIGDAVLAFWGPPFTTLEEHPLLACRAALGQLAALKTLRADLPELTGLRKNLPQVNLRIGISTGEVVVGNIGSVSARSYTVIGDPVNLGQRLETANKIYGTHLLVSEATREGAGAAVVAREIDFLVVKGKTESARIFEVLGLKGEVAEATLDLIGRFAEALAAYRSQEWDRAETALRGCLELFPDDGPSRLFLDRVRQLRAQLPGEEWDGVWRPASW
jgi:adenylate cyclase